MMRLISVELRRLLSRRVVVLAFLGAVLIAATALFDVHTLATSLNEQRANAQQYFEEAQSWWEPAPEEEFRACLRDQNEARLQPGMGQVVYGCEQMRRPPQFEDFLPVYPSMAEQYGQLLSYLVYPLMLLPLALGSTGVAAEFSHRTMGSWLTFVPRRGQVFASKLAATALISVPLVATGLVIVLLGVPALFRYHGIDDGVTGAQWVDLGWHALRIVLLGVLAGIFGAALAFLARHSAIVVGVILGYMVLVEGIVRTFLPWMTPYLAGTTIPAVADDGHSWTEWPTVCDDVTVSCRPVEHHVSLTHGATVLGVVVAVAVGLALLRFWRSDVD